MLRNPPSSFFGSFLTVLLTLFINKSDSSRHLTIFIISTIFSIEIINGVVPYLIFFLCFPASDTDAATVNASRIAKLLASVLGTFFIKGKPILINDPGSLPCHPPDCTILDS